MINSCSDYNFISILVILKRILSIAQLVVPIILIISCIWGLIKLMINPDDKKGLVGFRNKILAALIFIFIPYLVNMVIFWVDESFSIGGCWTAAEEYKAQLDATEEYSVATSTKEKKFIQKDATDYYFNGATEENGSIKGTAKGKEIVKYALSFVGKQYVWGGGHGGNETLEQIYARGGGVDCSGFTAGVYRHFGYNNVNGTTWTQENAGREVSYSEAEAGDLILYEGHVAIFMGDGNKIVHASSSLPFPEGGIKISDDARYRTIKTVRRII